MSATKAEEISWCRSFLHPTLVLSTNQVVLNRHPLSLFMPTIKNIPPHAIIQNTIQEINSKGKGKKSNGSFYFSGNHEDQTPGINFCYCPALNRVCTVLLLDFLFKHFLCLKSTGSNSLLLPIHTHNKINQTRLYRLSLFLFPSHLSVTRHRILKTHVRFSFPLVSVLLLFITVFTPVHR